MRPGRNDNASGKAGEVGANQNIQPAQDTTALGVTQATIREATGYPVAVAATQRTPANHRHHSTKTRWNCKGAMIGGQV